VGYGLKQNGGDLFLAFPKIPRVPASPGCPQACLKYPRLFPGISPLGSLACFLSPKMSDFLAHLTSAPSRPHGSANITDKCYDHQLRDLIAYLKQPGVAPSTADLNGYLEVRGHCIINAKMPHEILMVRLHRPSALPYTVCHIFTYCASEYNNSRKKQLLVCQTIYSLEVPYGNKLLSSCDHLIRFRFDTLAMNGDNSLSRWPAPRNLFPR
jgi:hypothetical protein